MRVADLDPMFLPGSIGLVAWAVRNHKGRRARRGHEEHASSLYSFGAEDLVDPLLGGCRGRFYEGRGACSNAIARRLACERHFSMCC